MKKNEFKVEEVSSGYIQLIGQFNDYTLDATCRFDDCNHLHFKCEGEEEIYLHIDGLDNFIAFLQELSDSRVDPRDNINDDDHFHFDY